MKSLLAAAAIPFLSFAAPDRAAAAWQQHAANPVLTATEPWEGSGVHEPTVLRVRGRYLMYYNAGNWFRDVDAGLGCAVGVATSRDAIRWLKYKGNPLIGQGRLGVARACHNHVVYRRGRFYLFYSDGNLKVATSRDGFHFSPQPRPLLDISGHIANPFVWLEGTSWRLLYEFWTGVGSGLCDARACWATSLASGRSPQAWRPAPMLGFITATVGGPWLEKKARGYRLYYHSAAKRSATLPTDIYYRDSANLVHFGPAHVAIRREQPWELDQVADPTIVRRPMGKRLMFFDGDDNIEQFSAIGLAVER